MVVIICNLGITIFQFTVILNFTKLWNRLSFFSLPKQIQNWQLIHSILSLFGYCSASAKKHFVSGLKQNRLFCSRFAISRSPSLFSPSSSYDILFLSILLLGMIDCPVRQASLESWRTLLPCALQCRDLPPWTTNSPVKTWLQGIVPLKSDKICKGFWAYRLPPKSDKICEGFLVLI